MILRDGTGVEHRVEIGANGAVTIDGQVLMVTRTIDGGVTVAGDSLQTRAWAACLEGVRWVFVDGNVFTFDAGSPPARSRRSASQHATLMAPMPATVRRLNVVAGDAVRKNDVLIVLEAMKMELPIRATGDAHVARIHCREGDLVQPGVSLIELDD